MPPPLPARIPSAGILTAFAAAAGAFLSGTAPSLAGITFKKDIQPIFEKRCYSCHSEKAKKEKGGYVFDNLERLKSDIGPSFLIRPGDPGNSDLIAKVNRTDKHKMPPDDKDALSATELKRLEQWIRDGAAVDDSAATAKSGSGSSGLPAKDPLLGPLDWTSTEGKTIKATFVKIIGEKVTLRMAGGRNYEVPLSKLNEASVLQARKAAGASIR